MQIINILCDNIKKDLDVSFKLLLVAGSFLYKFIPELNFTMNENSRSFPNNMLFKRNKMVFRIVFTQNTFSVHREDVSHLLSH